MLNSVSIRWKIFTIAVVGLITFAGLLVFSFWANQQTEQHLLTIEKVHFPAISNLRSSKEQIIRINDLLNLSENLDQIEAAEAASQSLINTINQTILLIPDSAYQLEFLIEEFTSFFEQSKTTALDRINERLTVKSYQRLTIRNRAAFSSVIRHMDTYIESALSNFQETLDKSNTHRQHSLYAGIIITGISFLVLGLMWFVLLKGVLRKTNQISCSLVEIVNESTEFGLIETSSADEIGNLISSHNRLMMDLSVKATDLKGIKGNLHHGLLIIYQAEDTLLVHKEYSTQTEEIFETTDIAGKEFQQLLLQHALIDSSESEQLITALDSMLNEDEMIFEFNAHLLPGEIVLELGDEKTRRIKILEMLWSPILKDGTIDKIMVSIRDISELKKAEKIAQLQQEELEIIAQTINTQPAKFYAFLKSSFTMLEKNKALIESTKIKDSRVIAELFVNMHTIKVNSRTHGFKRISEIVHRAESSYDRLRKEEHVEWLPQALLTELEQVHAIIDKYRKIKIEKLDARNMDGAEPPCIHLDEKTWDQLVADCDHIIEVEIEENQKVQDALQRVSKAVKRMGGNSLSEILTDVIHSLAESAITLEKETPSIAIDDGEITIKVHYQEMLINVFTHILRNAIDHGIEGSQERLKNNKQPVGKIFISATHDTQKVSIIVKDDGRGLAIKRLCEVAQGMEKGPAIDNLTEVANLIFESGVSTAEKLSDISGRGVGMHAVRRFLNAQGANIYIKLQQETHSDAEYVPFELQIELPKEMFIV